MSKQNNHPASPLEAKRHTPSFLRMHQFAALEAGPRLIVLGAVHGNETCGTRAIERLLQELEDGTLAIERGTLTLVPVTNPLAYQMHRRHGDRNLNRNLRPATQAHDFEDRIANVLCPWLGAHDVLLDLHSFHTGGQPFAMLGPRNNRGELEAFDKAGLEARMVAHLGPQRVVEGWLGAYARGVQRRRDDPSSAATSELRDTAYGIGTTEYMRSQGGYGVTLECGQHDDPAAPEVAYRAIRQTLALLGMVDIPLLPPQPHFQVLKLVDVIDRDHEDDVFVRDWSSFDTVKRGELIGQRHTGQAILAAEDGFIVFPNPHAIPGSEWFYFAKESDRALDATRSL